jgi:hypothetical protein
MGSSLLAIDAPRRLSKYNGTAHQYTSVTGYMADLPCRYGGEIWGVSQASEAA